jgi:WD40 repeat protein
MTIATTFDNEHFFSSVGNSLRQYQVDDHTFLKKYLVSATICASVATFDKRYVFVGLTNGTLNKICLHSQEATINFGGIRHYYLWEVAVTRDSNFLITCGHDGTVRKISITNQEVVKDFGRITRDYNSTV